MVLRVMALWRATERGSWVNKLRPKALFLLNNDTLIMTVLLSQISYVFFLLQCNFFLVDEVGRNQIF